ncbi:TrkA family potassium uptake protein [Alkalihalobacillus sp. AL-G]|uniref:potassium channel family protein n=1 Tax=Alkalihalobacillus sp. AL-G TaxID=2926399 RepID=UPI00272B737F|nr:TrkA family potassium uptake protein [Alkalihalobacillus sp. AL-G]WLD92652.1 TrkA family potassium uptake protein [Alkalihalobacillus sp. AL-G]
MKNHKNRQFAVLGLGRFGGSLVQEFHELGVEVLAVDIDVDKVNEHTEFATHAVQVDTVDEGALEALGIRNFDYVIVSFGENLQSSILTTLHLKELGVKNVWVKAQNEYHHKVLEKIGADRIIHPERDMAIRVAHHIVSEKVLDFIELSDEYSIIEVVATEKVADKSLLQLDTRAKYGCTIVAIRSGKEIKVAPSAEEVVLKDDVLVLIGHNKDLSRFEEEGV